MGYSADIFRSYDIRGIVPNELDEAMAERIGRAFVVYTSAKNVVVGRDMRTTGESIMNAFVRGAMRQGANVLDIGLSTTPLLYFSVWKAEADAGVMVTASHNPAEYNGFKMTKSQAIPISKDSGLLDIRDIAEREEYPDPTATGTIRKYDASGQYISYVTSGTEELQEMTAVVDTGNGIAGLLLSRYAERLPDQVKVVGMYTELDGTFPNHEANPLKAENVKDLRERVLEEHAQIGAAFDGDGDRVGFVDERGVSISGDLITALLAQEILADNSGAVILYDLRSSRIVPEVIRSLGGIPMQCRVGHSYIKEMMRENNAVFAGELSSHFYFGEYFAESAYRALTIVLRILSRENKPLSELIAPLQKYAKSDEINFHIEDKEAAIAEAKRRYSSGTQSELDGLMVEYPEWWFNLRASGTEPLLRLNMEADTPELLEQKKRELFSFLGQPE